MEIGLAGSRIRFGVAARLQAGLTALALFVIGASVIAVISFNELRKSLDRIASIQLDTMVAAAQLRQDSEAIAGLAPTLFAKGLEQSTLLDFSIQVYNRQAQLQAQIDELAKFVDASDEIPEIEETSAALFENIDALSTTIFSQAVAEDGLNDTLRRLSGLLQEAEQFLRTTGRVKPGQVLTEVRPIDAIAVDWAREIELMNASLLTALTADNAIRLAAAKNDIVGAIDAAGQVLAGYPLETTGLRDLHARLAGTLIGDRGIVSLREQLITFNSEVRQLLAQNENQSRDLVAAVDTLINRVRADISKENDQQGALLSSRSQIMEIVAALGFLGAIGTATYFQFSVIRRLKHLRNYIRDEKSIERVEDLTKSNDEISDMAETFLRYSNEIKIREEALRASELRFRHLFESAPISIWAEDWSKVKLEIDRLREMGVTDLREHILNNPDFVANLRDKIRWVDTNDATTKLYGASDKESLRRHIAEVASVEAYPDTILQFAEGARQVTHEVSDYRIDGREIRVIETYHMSDSDSHDWSRIVACMLDITDRKRAEEQLQIAKDQAETALEELKQTQQNLIQSEKMASLGQLTAGIAHEIKNPLNFINNFSEVSVELLDELREILSQTIGTLGGDSHEDMLGLFQTLSGNLNRIREHGQRADRIVRSMLSHAREGSTEPSRIDINMLIEDALNLAYHGARAENPSFNVTINRHFDENAGDISALPQEITRVLLNIFTNGFYATQKRREAGADPRYAPTISVSTQGLGDTVKITIRDNGTGIPSSAIDKIFNPFFTTKPAGEGTGLGLSLSYDIVTRQHNGRFDVATELGEFTEFAVTLPRNYGGASRAKEVAQ